MIVTPLSKLSIFFPLVLLFRPFIMLLLMMMMMMMMLMMMMMMMIKTAANVCQEVSARA